MNKQSYFEHTHKPILAQTSVTEEKSFIPQTPEPNVVKLTTVRSQFKNVYNKLDFVPGQHFKPSIVFAGKARSLQWREEWSTWQVLQSGRLRPYSQTLD